MIVRIHSGGLRETKWYEYLLRFLFGGAITALTGVIGKHWGPVVAGLFLGFPAIFPASATLVQKHTRESKARKGLHGEQRGIEAAADDALGATIGSAGLVIFAFISWRLFPRHSPALVLPLATAAWLAAASSLWLARKWRHRRR